MRKAAAMQRLAKRSRDPEVVASPAAVCSPVAVDSSMTDTESKARRSPADDVLQSILQNKAAF